MPIIKAGPVCKRQGYMPTRLVLRSLPNLNTKGIIEFVVHVQSFKEDGTHDSFAHGNYFPVRCYANLAAAQAEAEKRFEERGEEFYKYIGATEYQHPQAILVTRMLEAKKQPVCHIRQS